MNGIEKITGQIDADVQKEIDELTAQAQAQAAEFGHSVQREMAYLAVHSVLHLLGYDHENGGLEAMRMREKEEAVLTQLGLPRTVSYTE